jgi:hypothetical protein
VSAVKPRREPRSGRRLWRWLPIDRSMPDSRCPSRGGVHEATLFGLVAATTNARRHARVSSRSWKRLSGTGKCASSKDRGRVRRTSSLPSSWEVSTTSVNDGLQRRRARGASRTITALCATKTSRSFGVRSLRIPTARAVLHAAQTEYRRSRCLGCLIRGATPHSEYISSAVGTAHGRVGATGFRWRSACSDHELRPRRRSKHAPLMARSNKEGGIAGPPGHSFENLAIIAGGGLPARPVRPAMHEGPRPPGTPRRIARV